MVLVRSDEHIKYLNSSFIAKLRDYNIVIPSLTIPSVPSQEAFKEAVKDNGLGDNQWIDDVLACMDIAYRSCKGCDTKQTDYGQCNAGCFGANTCGACVGSCNGGDAVCISCNAQSDDEEIIVCESCNTGCESCDADCYGCNAGCQGAQTCTSCNNGQEIPCEYTAGCTDCQEGHEHEDPTYGCTECVRACVAPDSCGAAQIPNVPGCTSGNNYEESEGCSSGNKACPLFYFGRCDQFYSSNGTDISCDAGYYGDGSTTCTVEYGSTGSDISCNSDYAGSGGACESRYSANPYGTNCSNNYTTEIVGCQKHYNTGSGTNCAYLYSNETDTCVTGYTNSGTDVGCTSSFSNSDTQCSVAYTATDSGTTCITDYTQESCSQSCSSDYGLPTCSGCNATRNDQCLVCVSSQDTCTACINGEAASCTSCVEAQGCSDCQGCDSGCNADVSCAGYSVGDNGQNVCVGNFTDTNCGQTCVGGFDSSTQCLSGQGCSSCDTCQGCNECQGGDGPGCTSCDSGCQTCDEGCYNTCNDCQGCVYINCTGNWGVCGQVTPPPPSTGDGE